MSFSAERVAKFRTKRRAEIHAYLGGKCATCGSSSGPFDVDHIDPSTKSYTIASNLQRKWSILVLELNKCQLLCKPCHIEKSADEKRGAKFPVSHGTSYGYRIHGCRCAACKSWRKRASTAERRRSGIHERKSWSHGTITGYYKYGCRCDDCGEVSRVWRKERKERRLGEPGNR